MCVSNWGKGLASHRRAITARLACSQQLCINSYYENQNEPPIANGHEGEIFVVIRNAQWLAPGATPSWLWRFSSLLDARCFHISFLNTFHSSEDSLSQNCIKSCICSSIQFSSKTSQNMSFINGQWFRNKLVDTTNEMLSITLWLPHMIHARLVEKACQHSFLAACSVSTGSALPCCQLVQTQDLMMKLASHQWPLLSQQCFTFFGLNKPFWNTMWKHINWKLLQHVDPTFLALHWSI